eukprot:m.67683 g.67683  ORF g.67683 m.67683 type:complete len:224 (-) comp11907_c0_seq4:325-996(-)
MASKRRRHDSNVAGKKKITKKKTDYKAVIQGYDKMTQVEKMKARTSFDLRHAAAYDDSLREDNGRWERFKFDRNAPIEQTKDDLPEMPSQQQRASTAIDFEDESNFDSQEFVGNRYMKQFKSENAATDHEAAIFGTTSTADLSLHERYKNLSKDGDKEGQKNTPKDEDKEIVIPKDFGKVQENVAGTEITQAGAKKKNPWLEKLKARKLAQAKAIAAAQQNGI